MQDSNREGDEKKNRRIASGKKWYRGVKYKRRVRSDWRKRGPNQAYLGVVVDGIV